MMSRMRFRPKAIFNGIIAFVVVGVLFLIFLAGEKSIDTRSQDDSVIVRIKGVEFAVSNVAANRLRADLEKQAFNTASPMMDPNESRGDESDTNSKPTTTNSHHHSNATSSTNDNPNNVTSPEVPKTKVKLIILTYMRSGSSFTGDVYDHHPSVFYIYEPLWSIQQNYQHKEPIIYFNKSYPRPDLTRFNLPSSIASHTLENFLDCRHNEIDLKTLTQYHLRHSQTSKGFHSCHTQNPGAFGALRCLPLLESACKNAEVSVVKTIRYSMTQAENLMKRDPKVKVVHLVRDPRGTLVSQARVGEYKRDELDSKSKDFCGTVLNDLKIADKLKKSHPGRILTVRYEDLATEPLTFAEKLLAFAGLQVTQQLTDYLWNITSAGKTDDCAICTTRKDSKETANKWKKQLNINATKLVQSNCQELFKVMGYLPITTIQQLSNLTMPAFLNPSKIHGLWDIS